MRKAKVKEQQPSPPCHQSHVRRAECNKESKKEGGDVSGAKLRCFPMCLFVLFLSTESVTSSLLISNRVYWLKFPVADLGFLDHDRNKLFGRQKNMGC